MRGIKKLSAITLTAVLAFSSTVTAFGAEVTESVSYSKWGSKTVCEALGIDTAEYYKWIVNHDNDSSNDYQTYTVSKNYDSSVGTDYYLGTKYTSGDHRTPKGDTKGTLIQIYIHQTADITVQVTADKTSLTVHRTSRR